MKRKAYVGIRAAYYKLEGARAVLDHAHAPRTGFTRSQNVHPEFSHFNCGYYYHEASSCAEALELMLEKHKQVTGKKVRSDCNVLFEHVVWLSEHQYTQLERKYGHERVRDAFLARLKIYAESVRQEFGFEPIGIDLHLNDEGHYEGHDEGNCDQGSERSLSNEIDVKENQFGQNGSRFIPNVHAHLFYFNYDFKKRVAPLRHLMNSGKDEKGRTNALNPNFVRLQDLVAEPFKDMGFERGESKLVTGREHETKEQFVLSKLKATQQENDLLQQKCEVLARQLDLQRVERAQLAEQIFEQKNEAASWAAEIQKLKDQFYHLQQLIKQRAIAAVRQFAVRLNQLTSQNKPSR